MAPTRAYELALSRVATELLFAYMLYCDWLIII